MRRPAFVACKMPFSGVFRCGSERRFQREARLPTRVGGLTNNPSLQCQGMRHSPIKSQGHRPLASHAFRVRYLQALMLERH